ncbi:SLOG family protein [Kitasatospora sp. NPDC127116]|uniref:SLOG family protein n=1 Tax=Kitasatospora sp. NPDC127116 TaxID=3345367 RepID=UPI0036420BCD
MRGCCRDGVPAGHCAAAGVGGRPSCGVGLVASAVGGSTGDDVGGVQSDAAWWGAGFESVAEPADLAGVGAGVGAVGRRGRRGGADVWDVLRVAAGGVLVHSVRSGGDAAVTGVSRILVTGSRAWSDRAQLEWALGVAFKAFRSITVVHGACETGADRLAQEWAGRAGILCDPFEADWDNCGPGCRSGHRRVRRDGSEFCPTAGPRRNQAMVDAGARYCLAFLLPGSRGTRDCIRRAEAGGIPVRRFEAER